MSYIAFKLDAIPLVPKVARSAGIGEAVVGWGLTQMWEWCWREKTDRVTTNHLRGFFGSELGAILVDFGFLEAVGSSVWRVRGADRYLRISEARSKGGKAAAAGGNLKQGSRAPAGPSAGPQPQLPPSSLPAEPQLPPSPSATSEQRQATSDKPLAPPAADPKKQPAKPPTDSRYGPLVGQLKAVQPTFTDADGKALKLLLARGEVPEEILTRFRRGVTADRYSPKCATVLQLLERWPELGIVRGAGPPAGAASASATDWSDYREGDTARELFGGKP